MSFIPINQHLEVEPIEEQSFVASQNATFEEKGKVISIAGDCGFFNEEEIGAIVYFDSWLVARYTDSAGKERWLVPEQNIRAYEPLPEL